MAVISKDLGAVTAYAAAVNRGYTGTKEEFETLMASYAYVGEQAAESASNASQSATNASQSATNAETAKGTAQQAATAAQTAQASAQGYAQSAQQSAQSASQSAQNAESAKNTAVNAVDGFAAGAQQALDSVNQAGNNWKSLAQAKALDSEAYALGTRDGEDVGSSDPAYHNNAKYYAEQTATDRTAAQTSAQTATTKASEAQASAEAAAESARILTIDRTLTQSGQAADAKKTGDDFDYFDGTHKQFHVDAGSVHSATIDQIFVNIGIGEKYILSYKRNYTNAIQIFAFDAEGNATAIYATRDKSGRVIKTASTNLVKFGMTVTGNEFADDYNFAISKDQTNTYLLEQKANQEEISALQNDITTLSLGNAPLKSLIVGKRTTTAVAYTLMTIGVEEGRRYRIDMSNIDSLVGASLYLRLRKSDNSGNAYTAPQITGDVSANTKWTYYFDCVVTEDVVVQIYRADLTDDAVFTISVLCDDERRDISALNVEVSSVLPTLNMEVSRNLVGPDVGVLYPVAPLKTGDVITASAFNPSGVTTWCIVRFHASDGTQLGYFQFDNDYASTGRTVTLNLGDSTAYFISISRDCGSPLMVERGTKTDFVPHYTTNYENYLNSDSDFGEFELFLPDQAEIIRKNLATARMSKRLCFGHTSDNHSTVYPFICNIIDLSDAKFIVNTGDIVQDKYSDAYTNFPNMVNAMTKPHYITLGNHDVYKAPSKGDIFTKYFSPIISHNGQSNLDKTYYSVDFADEGVKCIFLDPYDALDDYSASMDVVIFGKMSETQINWLFAQLDDALTNAMHVCIFMHLSPEIVGEREKKFFDLNTYSRLVTYSFITDVIDAFIDGTSVTFNYSGSSYTHTFASAGVFVGYFCGHMHCDCIGKLKTHNRQNSFSVTRPWQSPEPNTIKDGTYRHGSSKWGYSAFNYVTVDPTTRHVSVMRVLQQETKYGFKRDFVTMEY